MATVSTAISSGAAELRRRSSRAPEYERENRALVRLARAQTGPRDVLLQTIVDAALELCCAGSAGISLVEEQDGNRYFRWLAVAGQVAGLRGNLTAWKDCPCGIALESQESLLLVDPLQTFEALRGGPAYISEGLVVPIETDGIQLGAIWVMSHSDSCRLEREDVRLLSSLSAVAGSALMLTNARDQKANDSRQRDEFIAMLSHELLGPMGPIDNAVTATKAYCAGNENALVLLGIAERQISRLRTLMDDLLDAVRLQHGKLRLDIKNVSLKEIAADAVASVQDGLEQRRLQLSVAGLDKDIILVGDHVRLSQVITNLLSNSVRYTPEGGRILLSAACEPDGKTVTIAVQDNGRGIAAEDLASVCNLFVQSRGGSKEANGGLGVGLAVVKRIVELHHGTLDVASAGTGKGTTVTVRLPICCEPNPSTDRHTGIETAPGVKPVSILLVDDCEDALQSLSTMLALDGHSVDTADSGAAAMRRLKSTKPDVAIVDICLPDADGFDVARAIRRDDSLDDIYLVALSGYADETDGRCAFAAGFNAYVTKPLSIGRLRAILAACRVVRK
ncbi:ATP-binding protein [Paraburkholderia sp. SIMBA_049]